MNSAFFLRAGGALMFLSVALGAFGAHGLKNYLSGDMRGIFETGVRYQIYHSLALFVVAWLSERNPSKALNMAGVCFILGILFFSGSLYTLSLSGTRKFGAVTPLGGLLFLIGWICVLFAPIQ